MCDVLESPGMSSIVRESQGRKAVDGQDRSDIIQIIDLYGVAIDARRWYLFDRIFTPDVKAAYSSGGDWTSLAQWKEDFAAAHEPFYHTQHAMMSHVVTIDGDEATAFTYVAWRLVMRSDECDDVREGSAWYDDSLVRTSPGWRIRQRKCQVTWAERRQIPAAVAADMMAATGIRQLCEVAEDGGVGFLSVA